MSIDGIIGWDAGGAHLKAARLARDGRIERVIQTPCPLWQGLDKLRAAMDRVLSELGPVRDHAITMTGELVDLFPNREEGVRAILDTVSDSLPGCRIEVFAGAAGFVDAPTARMRCAQVASANWRATAELVAASLCDALMIDIGSTTTDLVPVRDGAVAAHGCDDATRLMSQELLYLGVARTPLMALGPRWHFEGAATGICNEHFATTADVYRLTGELPERVDQHPAADGGAKTVDGSLRRLARMIGRDRESAEPAAWLRLARWLRRVQIDATAQAVEAVAVRSRLLPTAPIVGAGAGEFLVRAIADRLERRYVSFAELVGNPAGLEALSTCAPAVAVGRLALQG